MLLNILHIITDFVVLITRLMTEEFADEQRTVLIDQFVRLWGLDATFEFDLRDLLLILIIILTAIIVNAWNRSGHWLYRRSISRACSRTPHVSPAGPFAE